MAKDLVAGSPSDSIATKHGGSHKQLTHTKTPGGHPKPKSHTKGFTHGPHAKKM